MFKEGDYTYVLKGYSENAVNQVRHYIYNKYNHVMDLDILMNRLNKTNVRAAKSISNYMFKVFGVSLTDEDKEKIGTMLGKKDSETFTFKVTLGCDGTPSEYFHRSSCYWGGHTISREYIAYNKGGAIRAYDNSGYLMGRIWWIPYLNGAVLFNAYGSGDFQHVKTWANYLTDIFQVPYVFLKYLSFETKKAMYINSATHLYMGLDTIPGNEIDHYKLKEPRKLRYLKRCKHCRKIIYNPGDVYIVDFNDYYCCPSCLETYYCMVTRGIHEDRWLPRDLVVEIYDLVTGYTRSWFKDDPEVVQTAPGEYDTRSNIKLREERKTSKSIDNADYETQMQDIFARIMQRST